MPTPPSPHVCARCAKCCVIPPGDEGIIFPLFTEEVDRLEEAAQDLGVVSPVAEEPTAQALQDAMLRLFPDAQEQVRALLPVGSTHHRLGVTDDGYCVFLGEAGCVLPQEVRPPHCLLFPFWFRGERLVPLDADCLALREARTSWDALRALGLSEAGMREAYSRLLRSWGLCI